MNDTYPSKTITGACVANGVYSDTLVAICYNGYCIDPTSKNICVKLDIN